MVAAPEVTVKFHARAVTVNTIQDTRHKMVRSARNELFSVTEMRNIGV